MIFHSKNRPATQTPFSPLLWNRTWWIHTLAVTLDFFAVAHLTVQMFKIFLEFQHSLPFTLFAGILLGAGLALLHLLTRSMLSHEYPFRERGKGMPFFAGILLGVSLSTLCVFSFGKSDLPLQFSFLLIASLLTRLASAAIQHLTNRKDSPLPSVAASKIAGATILGAITLLAALPELPSAGRPLLFGCHTLIAITIFLLAILRKSSGTPTIEAAIVGAISRLVLLVFLAVFCTGATLYALRAANSAGIRDGKILASVKHDLEETRTRSARGIRELFFESTAKKKEIKCARIRIGGRETGNCNAGDTTDIKNVRSVQFLHSGKDASFDLYFDHSFVWAGIARRITMIFLLLAAAAAFTWYFSRRLSRHFARQMGSLLNTVNPAGGNSGTEALVYSDLLEFQKNLHDLLEIKKNHEDQISRLRIAKQLEHDLQSPLLVLQMLLPKGRGFTDEEREALQSSLRRIGGISKDLGKLDPRALEPKPATIPLQPMISVRDALEQMISEKKIEHGGRNPIHLEFDPALERLGLQAGPATFARVMSNLLNNAIEASPEKIAIVVSVRLAPDESLVLSVMDQGKGIPEEDLAKIGNYGFTNGKAGGSGIGLYSARNFLSELGAFLEVDSILDVGTTVSMRFPRECAAVVL
jgi:signal transduction histidine kinase